MKRLFVTAIVFALVTGFNVTSAVADDTQQADDRIVVKKSDLPPDLLQKIEQKQQVEKVGSWVGLGREVGTAVNEGLKAVTDHAANFGKTGVGMFVMVMIAWKVMGVDLLQLAIGLPLLAIGTGLFTWSYSRNCIPRKIPVELTSEGKVTRYEVTKPNGDEKITHAVFFLVFIVIDALVMFV
ncbi:MAG: hypothetical protein HYW90_01705 [Candidatus Sungbacteria bacterium]|nr:hypothetical protein [Candidatus Sungbacteria bacterium]